MKNLKTNIYKSIRNGWQAESMTEANANGQAWQISTHKVNGGVKCSATQGTLRNDIFSYEMFGAKRLELASEAGICNENKVRNVHAAGLIEFEKQISSEVEEKPLYVIGIGQIIFTESPYSETKRVIYEVEGGGSYKTVTTDGKHLRREDHIKPYSEKFGIGVYYNEGEIMPLNEVEILVESAEISQAMANIKVNERQAEHDKVKAEKIEKGKNVISEIPKGFTHVIVAEGREDDSDRQSDYFSYKTTETIFLAFSTHGRDIFSEMRKAAGKYEATKCYEVVPVKPEGENEFWSAPDEHREKYSMGAGYYLGDSKYSGWIIKKCSLSLDGKGYGVNLQALQIAAAEERFFCDVETEKETPNFEAVEVKPGTIQIIEYSEKAIAVIGDTKPIKDKLKELGGRFNFRLTCGAGWIFPKTQLSQLQTDLTA